MQIQPGKSVIGLIGTGVMGQSMAKHLLQAGYTIHVYNRTKSKADALLELGATWQETPAALAQQCDVILTIVGFPHDVEQIYFGPSGIIQHAKRGSFLVDMTTSSPALAQRIDEEARKRELFALDAPVSGGDVGAREARLSIMAGGDANTFEAVLPLFRMIGKNIVHQGKAGAGQHTKMSNQIAIASNMMGVVEALVYAKKAGLDPNTVLQSIENGAAGSWSLSNLAPRMIQGDFAPGFYVKHFIKDMGIALAAAEEMAIELPGLQLAKKLYDKLAAMGDAESGTQALFKLIDQGTS